MSSWLINGKPAEQVHVNDRGLQYGDGLFETLRLANGRLEYASRHWRRLQQGCERLGIACPSVAKIEDEIRQLVANTRHAVVKLVLTRGPGGRGYRPEPETQTTRILGLHPLPEQPPSPVTVRPCVTRLSINPVLAGIKHLNRLEQVLARREWNDAGILEGLMYDTRGRLVSGTMSNLFLRIGERVLCPPVDDCGIAGVTRSVILDILHAWGTPPEASTVTTDETGLIDEMLICNSVLGLVPVARIGERQLSPGSWSRALTDAWNAHRKQEEHHLCVT